MNNLRKVGAAVILGAVFVMYGPGYLMETVVKANVRNWLKPLAFRN